MFEDIHLELRAIIEDASATYETRKHESESQVTRWEWADGPRYDIQPLHFERDNSCRGDILNSPPPYEVGYYEYGFDKSGRLLVARQYCDVPGFYEEFYSYTAGAQPHNVISTILYTYSSDKSVINTQRLELHGRKALRLHQAYQNRSRTESYVYNGDFITGIIQEPDPTRTPNLVISYDQNDEVDLIKSGEYIVYETLPAGVTFESLCRIVTEKLKQHIPSAIVDIGGQEIAALALFYSWEGDIFPPTVCVGLQSACADVKPDPQAWKQFLEWPFEWSMDYDMQGIIDIEFERACHLLNQECGRMKDPVKKVVETYSRTAIELMKMKWPVPLRITSDFIGYAVDAEAQDFEASMEICLPHSSAPPIG